jgi:hypothetical protein
MKMGNSERDSRDPEVRKAFGALREADANQGASPSVEARLLSEVRAIRSRRFRTTAVFAMAAAVVLSTGAVLWRDGSNGPVNRDTDKGEAVVASRREITTPFFPLIHRDVSLAGGEVVRMELPRRALVSFGFATSDVSGSSSGTVLADVVVGEDGLARAIRFIRQSSK